MSEKGTMHSVEQFVTIDDDHGTLFMCEVIIQRTIENMRVVTYDNPQKAADYFQSQFSCNPIETVVLLDINMPELSGWEMLDILFMLDEKVKKFIKVIMLSSSIDTSDRLRAINHPCVTHYVEKPLTFAKLGEVMNKVNAEMIW